MTWAGLQGHLATITSAGEDNFAGATAAGGRLAWIAASDDGHEGSWTWRAGPESGQAALTYFNWSPGEPNNCCNGENYVHLNWGAGGSWNDHGGPATTSIRRTAIWSSSVRLCPSPPRRCCQPGLGCPGGASAAEPLNGEERGRQK